MEVAGFAVGAVALASLFSTCLECFDMIELGTNFSRDREILVTKLEAQRLIFSIWGSAIGLDNHGRDFNPRLLGTDAQKTITRLLNCIHMLFEDSEKLRNFYGLHKLRTSKGVRKRSSNIEFLLSNPLNPWDRFRRSISLRQKNTRLSTKIRWAIHDKAKFQNLIADLKDLIDQLRDITAAVADLEKQKKRFIDEISSVSDVHSLELLEEALMDDNPELSEVASQRIVQLTNGSVMGTLDPLNALSHSDFVTVPSIIDTQESPAFEEVLELESSENDSFTDSTNLTGSTSDLSVPRANNIIYGYQNNLSDIQIKDKIKIEETIQKWKELAEPPGLRYPYKSVAYQLRAVDEPFVSIAPVGDDLLELLGSIQGPSGTPYEGGVFFIKMKIPKRYPLNHPQCWFLTPVFHPNVDKNGSIRINILTEDGPDGWSPIWSIGKVLVAICSLLGDPDWLGHAFPEMAEKYGGDPVGFEMQARIFTQRYAQRALPSLESYSEAFSDLFITNHRVKNEASEHKAWLHWTIWIIFFVVFYGPAVFFISVCLLKYMSTAS